MQLTEFLKETRPKGFQPAPYYSPEGDTLTYFHRDRDHYGQRIDHLLTVYLDTETDELVGWKIKTVRRLLDVLGTFDVTTEHNADIPSPLYPGRHDPDAGEVPARLRILWRSLEGSLGQPAATPVP